MFIDGVAYVRPSSRWRLHSNEYSAQLPTQLDVVKEFDFFNKDLL